MGEENQEQTLLFRVRIDSEQYIKEIKDILKQQTELKKVQADLDANYKKGNIALREYTDATAENKIKSSELTRELSARQKAMALQVKADKVAADSIDGMKLKLDDLRKTYKSLSEEQKGSADGVALKKAIDEQSAAYVAANKELNKSSQTQEVAKDSVIGLREELKTLKTEYYAMTAAERESAKGKELQAHIKGVNDSLKEIEGGIGVFSRSVGDYTGGILKAADGTGMLGEKVEQLKEIYSQLSEFVSAAKEAILQEAEAKIASKQAAVAATTAETVAIEAGTVAEAASTATTVAHTTATNAGTTATNVSKMAILGNVAALKLLKFAFAATGIGAVLLLLGGLISFLTRTQEGMDFVSRTTKGFGAAITVLVDRLSGVGKAVFDMGKSITDAFTNPKKALTDLVNFIGTNLMNRLKAFAVVFDGLRSRDLSKVTDGLVQMGTGIENSGAKLTAFAKGIAQAGKDAIEAAKAGATIERQWQKIEDLERSMNVERANSRKIIKELNLIAEDTNKSTQERAAAARKALNIELGLQEKQVALQKQVIKNIEAENALKGNTIQDEDEDKLMEAQKKLQEIQQQSLELQTTLNNKLNTINQQAAAKAEAALKKQLESEKAAIEAKLIGVQEGSEQELALRKELAQKQFEIETAANETSKNQRLLAKAKLNEELLKLDQEYALKLADTQFQEDELAIKDSYARKLISKEEYDAQLVEMDRNRLNQQLNLEQQYGKDTLAIRKQVVDSVIANNEREFQDSLKLSAQYFDQAEIALKESYANQEISKTELDEKLRKLDEGRLAQQLLIEQDYGQQTLDTQTRITDNKIANLEREREAYQQYQQSLIEAENDVNNARLEGAQEGIAILEGFFDQSAGLSKAFFLTQKAFAIGEILIKLQQEVAQIYANPSLTLLPDAGLTLKTAMASAARLRAGIGLASVAAQTIQSMEEGGILPSETMSKGGVLRGPSHKQGGIKGTGRFANIEVEGDEIVLTKGVKRDPVLFQIANLLNIRAGGKNLMPGKFNQQGGIITPDLPAVTRNGLAGGGGLIDYRKLKEIMEDMPQPVVSVQEIESVKKRVAVTEERSNI